MIKVKICGIRTVDAAKAAVINGADYVGFIFFSKSHRYVAPEVAAEIVHSIRVLDPTKRVKVVGVFVDESINVVNAIADEVDLDYVQLHGHEDAAYALQIDRPIIKAWRYGDGFDVHAAEDYPCDIILIDSYVKGQAGGTGRSFDWRAASVVTRSLTKPLLIAGGISIDNVASAVETFDPYGVDVSGSLEIDGVKSIDLIEKFMSVARRL